MTRFSSRGAAALSVVRPPSPELATFLKKVYARENARVAGGSPTTLDDYFIQVGTLQKFFEQELQEKGEEPRPLTIDDITDPLVAGCMAWMKARGREARTCNKLRRTIRAIHTFAIIEKELGGKPLRVKKFKEPERQPRAWRPVQLPPLLWAAKSMPPTKCGEWDGRDDLALILFILNTGTRITATMTTPKSLLDLVLGEVLVPAGVQKDKSDQPFDLLDVTINALKAMHASPGATLFGHWPYDRKVRQWPALTKRLKKILVKAGIYASLDAIPKRVELFHKLRKTFATYVKIKFGKRAAMELCGHSAEEVTDDYIDPTQSGDRPSCREALAGKLVIAPPDAQRRLFD
jgi:integrase